MSLQHRILCAAVLPLLAVGASAQTTAFGTGTTAVQGGFGGAIAIAGNDVLVGEAQNQMRSGLVYVYRRGQNGWTELAKVAASDKFDGDGFGASLDVSGSSMIVGAIRQNDGKGTAYVFTRNAQSGAFTETAKLTATDAAEGDQFGAAVAIEGDVAFVAAPGQTQQAGAVYAFRRQGNSWSQVAKLTGSATNGALFGVSLATDGERLFVGMPGFNQNTGQVVQFENRNGQWTEAAKLSIAGAARNDRFGMSLSLRAGELLVGSPGANGTGTVVAFHASGDSSGWAEAGRLTSFDGNRGDFFGSALAATPDAIWIGAPNARQSLGAIYFFDRSSPDSSVVSVRKLVSDVADARQDRLGGALAASSTLVAAAVIGDEYQSGTVVLFEKGRDGTWTQTSILKSPAERIASITGQETKCQADSSAANFNCGNVDMLSFVSVADLGGGRGMRLNDVWGWTDPETDREYALVGRMDGTAFVDITDPVNPRYLGELPKPDSANANVWRDIKVYENHAYIVADGSGPHGMQVFDLTRLRNVKNAPETFTMDAHYRNINSAHNIVINEETGFAYSVGSSSGGETCGGGLHMIDIRDPKNPKFAGCFADPQTGRASTGYSHDAQCVTYSGPDTTYRGHEICMGANETALSIADVTDKANPKALSRASYPNVGYSHQGWLTPDQQYFYMNDELDEIAGSVPRTRTIIWDVTDLDDPQLVGEFLGNTEATDHNLYIKDNLMYQSHYQAGLRIVDISDRANPVEIGYFDTVPYGTNTPGFGGSWSNYPYFKSGTIIVTSGHEGLFLLKKREGEPIS
jgi:choice-of-anchor B domain-containing protein